MTKNKKIISLFTLFAYLMFLAIAILHFHPSYSGTNEFVSDSLQSNNNTFKDPFLDDQSNCRLVQFSHSFYFNSSADNITSSFLPLMKEARITFINGKFESLKLTHRQLRAPPLS